MLPVRVILEVVPKTPLVASCVNALAKQTTDLSTTIFPVFQKRRFQSRIKRLSSDFSTLQPYYTMNKNGEKCGLTVLDFYSQRFVAKHLDPHADVVSRIIAMGMKKNEYA